MCGNKKEIKEENRKERNVGGEDELVLLVSLLIERMN